jgi:hypothetical protein
VIVALGRLAAIGVKEWLLSQGWTERAQRGKFVSPRGRVLMFLNAPHPSARSSLRPAKVVEDLRHLIDRTTDVLPISPGPPHRRPVGPAVSPAKDVDVEQISDESLGVVTWLKTSQLGPRHRDRTGNDEKGRKRHNGAVPLTGSPLDIRLSWRRSSTETTKLIGYFAWISQRSHSGLRANGPKTPLHPVAVHSCQRRYLHSKPRQHAGVPRR